MKRDEALAKFGGIYRLFRPGKYGGEFFKCVYCGDPADEIDHQPPITRVPDYRTFGLERELYITVPCCRECNILLSDALTIDLLEREVILKNKLAKKYRRVLKGRTWTEQEIRDAEFKGTLKKFVGGHARRRDRIEVRLDYEEGIGAFLRWLREEGIPLGSRE
jgi:5-methylcytosine-specific restriction endonuclease McrA